ADNQRRTGELGKNHVNSPVPRAHSSRLAADIKWKMSAGIWSGNPPRAQSPRALAACPNLDEFKVGTPAASAALVHGFAAQGKEATMHTYIRHAAIAVMLLGGTGTASAQQYYAADPVDPVIIGRPLQLTPAQRTTIYRTIIPQRRGRAPIVRERIITEPVAPVVQDYAYGYNGYDADYAYVPPPAPRAIVTPPAASGDYACVVAPPRCLGRLCFRCGGGGAGARGAHPAPAGGRRRSAGCASLRLHAVF